MKYSSLQKQLQDKTDECEDVKKQLLAKVSEEKIKEQRQQADASKELITS